MKQISSKKRSANHCRNCGREITITIFRGTGFCCQLCQRALEGQ